MAAARVPQILFLIADTGGGHRSAANAIRAAMALIAPEALAGNPSGMAPHITVAALSFSTRDLVPANWGGSLRPWHAELKDIFQECGTMPLRRGANLYGPTVEKRPYMWASLYHGTNMSATLTAFSRLNQSQMRRGLVQMLTELRPDVLVGVHPLLLRPTQNILSQLGVRLPAITVVTDLVRFHRAWAYPKVDACSVPTEYARDLTISLGMPPEKVHLLGMPIHPKFSLPAEERGVVRAALGLERDRFTVLLVGGGEGLGNLGEATRAIAAARLPVQLVVITGRNKALRQALEAERANFGLPAVILGFVENMPDIMRAADAIVTKAGPGTIAESLACGLPIVLTGAIPGQEVGNIDYVESQGVGLLARTPEAVVSAVERLLDLDPAAFAALRAKARALSNPRAAFDIGSLILSYVPEATAPSPWEHVVLPPRRRKRRRVMRGLRPRSEGRRRQWPLARRREGVGFAPSSSLLQRLPLLIRRRLRRFRISDTTEP